MIEYQCKHCGKRADVKDPVYKYLCAPCWMEKYREKQNGKVTPSRKTV